MSSKADTKEQKSYHTKATGNALVTAEKHAQDAEIKLFGSCFCPFVQRVWISLEAKHLPYQYIEVDPYQKPTALTDINPRGLVPALKHADFGMYESTVLMEYLEDLNQGPALLPPDPRQRAHSRLWSDHINRHIIPSFYHLLQSQTTSSQTASATTLTAHISTLVSAAAHPGPFFLGPTLSFVDIQLAPWLLRFSRVLGPYRGWPDAPEGSRWAQWIEAVEGSESVQATTSGDELYKDSYERYAENRPGTSQVADAVNRGEGLP